MMRITFGLRVCACRQKGMVAAPMLEEIKWRLSILMSFCKVYSILAALALLPAAKAEVDFAKDVHPILVRSCTSCHSGEKAQGGLALNTRAEILRGGSSGVSV